MEPFVKVAFLPIESSSGLSVSVWHCPNAVNPIVFCFRKKVTDKPEPHFA